VSCVDALVLYASMKILCYIVKRTFFVKASILFLFELVNNEQCNAICSQTVNSSK